MYTQKRRSIPGHRQQNTIHHHSRGYLSIMDMWAHKFFLEITETFA
jgi:hypothetical protein